MAYQFIHAETYSRKTTGKKFSVFQILAEAKRTEGSCPHVENPQEPNLIYGIGLDELEALHDKMASEAKMTNSKGQTRSIRKDQQTLGTVVLSFPSIAKGEDPKAYHQNYEQWKALSVEWLKEQYGDELKTVIEHTDESHPHLHAYMLPADLKANKYNLGKIAKDAFMSSDDAKQIEDLKERNKCGDRAYKQAWRDWQDSYFERVGIPCGMSRIGPGKRRLTRSAWQNEQKQAESLKRALSHRDSFVDDVNAKARKIIQEAKDQARKLLEEADKKISELNNQIEEKIKELESIKEKPYMERLLNDIREQGFLAGVRHSSRKMKSLQNQIQALSSENKILHKNLQEELLASDRYNNLNQALKDDLMREQKEKERLIKEKDDYKERWITLDNQVKNKSYHDRLQHRKRST
jgi:hypothetical protein